MKRLAIFPFVLFLMSPLLANAQSAVDERAIIAAASELDADIDAKDWDRVRRMLLEEVVVVAPDGKETPTPADDLVALWRTEMHDDKETFHLRGADRVTFDGADSAVLRSKVYAWQRVPDIPGDDLYERWADYHQELDRTEDGWRVRQIGYVIRLERGNLAVLEHRLPVPVEDATETAAEPGAAPGPEKAAGAAPAQEKAPASEPTAGDAPPDDVADDAAGPASVTPPDGG